MVTGLLGGIVLGGLLILAEYDAVRQGGSFGLLSLSALAVLPLLGCLAASPVAAACCLSRRSRRTAAAVLVACLLLGGITYAAIHIGRTIRTRAFVALAERSDALVDGIKAYERAYGEPPASLDSLIPEFLPSIPHTGIGAYPQYRYVVSKEPNQHDGNPWVLSVFTPSRILDFDQFVYYPLQNYPRCWCGNRLERIRDWAYIND